MELFSTLDRWIIAIVVTVVVGALKAEEVKQEEIAQEQLKESIALAKKDKQEQEREFKRLYAEAQDKTGFPGKERVAVNP